MDGLLFAIVQMFMVLRSVSTTYPTHIFPSSSNDIHIIDMLDSVILVLTTLTSKLTTLGLQGQPLKCKVQSPFGMPLDFLYH